MSLTTASSGVTGPELDSSTTPVAEREDGVEQKERYSEKYNMPDGNVEIVSSDDLVFRVHSYTLKAAR